MAGQAPLLRRPRAAPPLRTCLVCRQRGAAHTLVRLRRGEGEATGRLGRSGYVCIAARCLAGLLRQDVDKRARLLALAQRQVLDLLGLARRSGQLIFGVEAIAALPEERAAVVVAATDLAARGQRQLAQPPALVPATELGRAVGRPAASAVAILGGRLGLQAAYWLRVWYETRVVEQQGVAR